MISIVYHGRLVDKRVSHFWYTQVFVVGQDCSVRNALSAKAWLYTEIKYII